MAGSRCPCGSDRPYAACCRPLHRGEREAVSPVALMRSRYAAFAAGEVDYLWKTLHPDHEDRAAPKATVLAALREACRVNRYTGLTIKGETPPDAEGVATVTFVARVFRKGRDVSFGERSMFARTSDGWRYLAGELLDNAPPKG